MHQRPWLVVYRNETKLVGVPEMPVIITETGWCRDFCTEEDRANWTAHAWTTWHDDLQVEASCPFLLEGAQWWPKGFPWIAADGISRLPVYTESVALRCRLLPETCNDLPAHQRHVGNNFTASAAATSTVDATGGSGAGSVTLPAPLSPTIELMSSREYN